MILRLPLSVALPRKKRPDRVWILNLNSYRNAHYHILNAAKVAYKEQVWLAMKEYNLEMWRVANKPPFEFKYTVYPGSARSFDLANICSVIDKFTCDALQEFRVISNDNYKIIQRTIYSFGAIDKERPRCGLEIMSIYQEEG